MPVGPHIFAALEDALAECFKFHNQLDSFLLRAGLSNERLSAARQRAEIRKGKWPSAPKRFVAQEVLEGIRTGKDDDDLLVASLITALCRLTYADATPKGVEAIKLLKNERTEDAKAAAKKREQHLREQEAARRERDRVGEARAAQRLAFKERFLALLTSADTTQARGYALETLLNDFMEFEGLCPRGSFKIVGEQIDGSFTWSGHTSLVEAKWTTSLVDGSSFGAFEWKINGKTANTRGLFIAINGYSIQAIKALNGKGALRFVCIDGAHLLRAFDYGFSKLLEIVWRYADETGEAYLPVSSPQFTARGG
jgi:hypothetical protein